MVRVPRANNWISFGLLGLALISLIILAPTGCSLVKPATEVPAPSKQKIEKSFFGEFHEASQGKIFRGNKNFLCAWAPVAETGFYSELLMLHNVGMTQHCNLQFEISQDQLVGLLVNPSYPKDKSRWKTLLTIPIVKHYYYEKKKDQYGRDTNEFIENDQRSEWRARPYIELDFTHISIKDLGSSLAVDGNPDITSVEDIEWDKDNGYLGFTIAATSSGLGIEQQGKYRFNILAFQHNDSFKETPFDEHNSRRFNILHILGEKVEGVYQILKAAHWDLSKKHDIYLVGFPKEYIPIGYDVVNAWNEKLAAIGHPNAFRVKVADQVKYAFDLRRSSIIWISDKRISVHAPLGVGMAQADVKNGEILWGSVAFYGGFLEEYIKRFSDSDPAHGSSSLFQDSLKVAANPKGTFSLSAASGLFSFPELLSMPDSLVDQRLRANESTAPLAEAMVNSLNAKIVELQNQNQQTQDSQNIKERIKTLESGRDRIRPELARVLIDHLISETSRKQRDTAEYFRTHPYDELLGLHAGSVDLEAKRNSLSPQEKSQIFEREGIKALRKSLGAAAFDRDLTFKSMGLRLYSAVRDAKDKVPFEESMRVFVKELLLHEVGHVLGLGHNFEENILPEKGSVPDRYYDVLLASAKNGMTNLSTVMGYRNPVTMLKNTYAEISPGPMDELVLRYLYNQQYSTYRSGDSDFTFVPLPVSAKIPEFNPGDPDYKTSYFPSCNDLEASLNYNPYCNRHARGYDAETIVQDYIDDLNNNEVSKLIAFTDARGDNVEEATNALWNRSVETLGRIRIFYDYMRVKYDSVIREFSKDPKALYDFSTCGDVQGDSDKGSIRPVLEQAFQNYPELKMLCRVNRMAIENITRIVSDPGRDFNKMDYKDYIAIASQTGGDVDLDLDHGRMFGSWKELSSLPRKIAALNVLTTPQPYVSLDGRYLFPIPQYSDPGLERKFLYSSLYPKEYTKAIAAAVAKNLTFGTSDPYGSTSMGRAVLALGYFLDQSRYSNEIHKFQEKYLEYIRTQTDFRFESVAILLTPNRRPDNPNRVTGFRASIFDFSTFQKMAMTDAYVLPGGKLLIRGPSKMFIYPYTTMSFLDDDLAYVLAYKVEYDIMHGDILWSSGVKNSFQELHQAVLQSCIDGQKNGLSTFFNDQKDKTIFQGFEVLPGIATDENKQRAFLDSVQSNFDRYYSYDGYQPNSPHPDTCFEALKGEGLIASTAAILNGSWLPEISTLFMVH